MKEDDKDYPQKQWYDEYIRLGGKHTNELFLSNVQVFHDICAPSYVYGEGEETRAQAFARWETFIGSKEEAGRYFEAVDNITAFS